MIRPPLPASCFDVMTWNGIGDGLLVPCRCPGANCDLQLPETIRSPDPHLRECSRSVFNLAGIRIRLTPWHSYTLNS